MSVDRCVCCGAIIPEGIMVCPLCEKKAMSPSRGISKTNVSETNPRIGRGFASTRRDAEEGRR